MPEVFCALAAPGLEDRRLSCDDRARVPEESKAPLGILCDVLHLNGVM
jgi:hypothetical protein